MVLPFDRTANVVNPKSIPTSWSMTGSGSVSASITNEAKYRPAVSLTSVTEDGDDGSSRDQRTFRSPIFAAYRRPFGFRLNPLRVSRITCRLSLRDRNRGAPTLRPLRLPDIESNQLRYAARASWHACTRATDATSDNQARSGVRLASVTTRRCTSVAEIFSPAEYASCLARSASLYTTRAHPNALASASRWPGVG